MSIYSLLNTPGGNSKPGQLVIPSQQRAAAASVLVRLRCQPDLHSCGLPGCRARLQGKPAPSLKSVRQAGPVVHMACPQQQL